MSLIKYEKDKMIAIGRFAGPIVVPTVCTIKLKKVKIRGDNKYICPVCEKDIEIGKYAYAYNNSNVLFPITFVHQECLPVADNRKIRIVHQLSQRFARGSSKNWKFTLEKGV